MAAIEGTTAIAERLCQDLPAALDVHLHQIDLLQDRVLLLRLARENFVQASFLDQRVVKRESEGCWFGWDQLGRCVSHATLATAAHYLFHVGHCGSTLLSRLLAELGVLPLREPLPLRTLAEVHADLDSPSCRWSRTTFDTRLALTVALYDRGHEPRMVKATSYCNDLAHDVLALRAASRAIACYVAPRPYIANILIGPSSRLDLLSMAPLRLRRLDARVGGGVGRLSEMRPGVIAAMSWAAEMSALAALRDADARAAAAAAMSSAGRVYCVDFDAFLDDVPGALRRLADQVVAGIPDERIVAAALSPALKQYSKAPELAFDAQFRRRLLADAEAQFGEEIRAGLRWCETSGARFAPVARALDYFGGGAR
jgi:hypothetical protein